MNLKAALVLAGTIVSLTNGAANAQTSQSNEMLRVTRGNISNTNNISSIYEKPRSEALQGFQSIRPSSLGENKGVGNTCGSESLTQSSAPDFIGNESVWCGINTTNAETSLGRGFVAPFDLTLDCVTFGIRENSGGEALVHVRILVGSPSSAYSDLTLVSETIVVIADGEELSLVTADIEDTQIPAGSQFIVELNTPTRMPEFGGDGGLLSFGTNKLGQNGPTFFRGPGCGADDFADVTSFGFGDRHLIMSLGIDSGITSTIAGGFDMTLLGDGVMSLLGDDLMIAGNTAQGEFGVDINYGDFTSGVGASFQVVSNPGESAALTVGYSCPETTREFTFAEFQDDPSQTIVTLDSGDLGDELFDVYMYNDGEIVGFLEDQSSGSVIFPGQSGPVGARCTKIHPSYLDHSIIVYIFPLDVSHPFDCVGFAFDTSKDPNLPVSGATSMTLSVSNASALTVNAGESSPVVMIGEAETNPHLFSDLGTTTQIGVPVRMNKGELVDAIAKDRLYATDVDANGVADLQIFAPVVAPGEDDSIAIDMLLGGVERASFDVGFAENVNPCLSIALPLDTSLNNIVVVWLDPNLNPFPNGNDNFGIRPDFTDVGNENYTLELYHDGALQFTSSGNNGFAGGSSELATTLGVFGGDVVGFEVIYPDLTTFTTADGQTFNVDELHVLTEEAPPVDTLAILTVMASDFTEMVISNPTTVLPSQDVCAADFNGDGVLDFFDISAFLTAFSAMDSIADLNQDGAYDFFDISAFLISFSEGCP